jgi:hypothetical protein
VQRAAAEPAAQGGVDRGDAERQRGSPVAEAGCRLGREELPAQPIDHRRGRHLWHRDKAIA